MKVIGVTTAGNVLVEMGSEQAYHLSQLVGVAAAVAPATVAAPAAPVAAPKAKASKAEPKQAGGTGNKCVICGKPCKRMTCSDACRKQKDRNYANEWYARNKAIRPATKAKATTQTVVTSALTGQTQALTQADSHARIRAALERADAKLGKGTL